MRQHLVNRRVLLAAAFAIAVPPKLAFGQNGTGPASQEPTGMKISITLGSQIMTATLSDNPSAREFYAMLPLDLMASDFGGNEKIATLPRKLSHLARGPFPDAAPGDLCYYVPWGNLALFHSGYESISDLVRLGRFDSDIQPLRIRGELPLRVERAA